MTAPTDTPDTPDTNTENERAQVMVSMPDQLKKAIEDAATKEDQSVASFCREVLAKHIDYQGPLTREYRRARKFESEEDRKKAQAAKQRARRDFIKKLMDERGEDFRAELQRAEEEAINKALANGDSEGEDTDDDTEDTELV